MNREEAIYKIGEMIDKEEFGSLSTGMCEALDISMDNFLTFAQMPAHNQKNIIIALWNKLSPELYGQ